MSYQIIRALIIIAGIFFPFQNSWADPPDWASQIVREDLSYRYYLGRSADSLNEAAAYNEATRDAYDQAIRENFGIKTRVQTESYESAKESSTTRRIDVVSKDIELHDFEQLKSHSTENSGKYSAWVLYRYPKYAIEFEKSRLERAKGEDNKMVFQEAGTPLDSSKGILEVVTKPSGAQIFIDDLPVNFLETPMRLFGKLPYGKHRLRVEHPQYVAVEEDIIISPGSTVIVKRTLIRAVGRIKIVTTPSNANVLLNGKPMGTTPTEEITVPAHELIKIEISHAEAEKVSQEIEVEKDDSRIVDLILILKPALLSVTSNPMGAEVLIGEHVVGKTPLKDLRLRSGEYEVQVVLKGHEEFSKRVTLHGGEKLLLSGISLRKWKDKEIQEGEDKKKEVAAFEEERKRESEKAKSQSKFSIGLDKMIDKMLDEIDRERNRTDRRWLIGVYLGLGSTPISGHAVGCVHIGMTLEKNFYGLFNLQSSGAYLSCTSRTGSSGSPYMAENQIEGFEFAVGIPIYLSQHFFILPEYGVLRSTLKVNPSSSYTSSNTTKYSLQQSFYGMGLGLYEMKKTWGWTVKLGVRDYSSPGEIKGTQSFFGTFNFLIPF